MKLSKETKDGENFKVVYQYRNSPPFSWHCDDREDYNSAKKRYEKMRNNTENGIEWAELIYSDIEGNPDDDDIVLESFDTEFIETPFNIFIIRK